MGIRDQAAKRRRSSLDQLEGTTTPPPNDSDTFLVGTCLRLRKVPIGDFTDGDLRIMIGQQNGLFFLVPLALERLQADPLVEATYYPGDLLCAVLRIGGAFWRRHRELRMALEAILGGLDATPDEVAEAMTDFRSNAT